MCSSPDQTYTHHFVLCFHPSHLAHTMHYLFELTIETIPCIGIIRAVQLNGGWVGCANSGGIIYATVPIWKVTQQFFQQYPIYLRLVNVSFTNYYEYHCHSPILVNRKILTTYIMRTCLLCSFSHRHG